MYVERTEERLAARFEPGRVPSLRVSIMDEESDPWRVLVTVCTVDGSCRDAARGVMATSTATGMGVNN